MRTAFALLHPLPLDHDGQHDLYDLRGSEGEDGVPRQPVGQHGLHVMPMTRRPKPRSRRVSSRSTSVPVAAPPSVVAPAIVLNSAPTYIAFGYLLVVGILLAFFKVLTLFVGALAFAIVGWVWFGRRFPRTAYYLWAFMSGLCGGRRGGRW